MQPDCLFCKIIAGSIPATVAYQDEHLTAIRDINPAAPSHILLMPNRHVASLNEATPEDAQLLGALTVTAVQLAQQEGLAKNGYRLVINTGSDAGQSVQHLHLHLLGGRAMRWPPG